MTQNKTYIFNVIGMSCSSCVELIESELRQHHKILYVKPILKNNSVEIIGDFEGMELDDIVKELNTLLSNHSLTIEKQDKKINWREFAIAIPIVFCFIFLFVFLQKIGIVNLVGSGEVTYGTAFIVGVVASLSTCMAVVGGLVLSMSATFARAGDRVRPQILFHIGRIISFFILGGIIGAIGSAFQLNLISSFVISVIIGLVMIILGLNLLDIFGWSKKIQPSMPKFLSKYVFNAVKINHMLTPVLVGVLTFFLPCGFTQSMQIYTLSTGSFLTGGLTMFSFALGTLPALALLSFSSVGIKNNSKSGIFFKSAGLIVIIFALFNIINAFVAIGLINPVFNF